MAANNVRTGGGNAGGTHGLTLLEVLVATGVFVVGLTALVAALLGAMAGSAYSKAQSTAIQDAKGVLEQLLLQQQEGTPATPNTLLGIVNNINAGQQTPGGTPALTIPVGNLANLPNEVIRVDVLTPPNIGAVLGPGGAVLPAALPTATRDEYEIVVTVSWTQGARPVSVSVRTVRNILSLT